MTVQRIDDHGDWSSTLAAMRGGSPAAFERMYRRLAPTVAGYLRMSAVTDVEGLTNEVFLHVHRGLARFSGDWHAFRSCERGCGWWPPRPRGA